MYYLFTEGPQLDCDDEKKLELFEPENDQLSWTRHLKHVILATVGISILIQIVVSSVGQLGDLKS